MGQLWQEAGQLAVARWLFLAGHEALWPPYDSGLDGFVRLLRSVLPALSGASQCSSELLPSASHVWVDTCENHVGTAGGPAEYAALANDRRHSVLDLALHHDLDPERPYLRQLLEAGAEPLLALEPVRVDVLGLDYYCHSEWFYDESGSHSPSPQPAGIAALAEQYSRRYGMPMVLSETNVRGLPSDRASWLRYMLEQYETAVARGVDLRGYCWFPYVGDRWCSAGRAGLVQAQLLASCTRESRGAGQEADVPAHVGARQRTRVVTVGPVSSPSGAGRVLARRPARATLRQRNAGRGAGPPGDADDRDRHSQGGAQFGRGRSAFRTDIQGLRAVAVLVVVAYHAGLPGISGGYVGVDVFFVISGFLITGLLWRELAATGALPLAAFYARRVRRLLPAAVLVLVATLGASWLWLAPLQVPSVARDAAAAALYAANYRFALQGTDYLSAQAPPSPVQHFWSLGVEEQFYLLWPVLLVLAAAVLRPARLTRAGAAWGLGVLGAGSFVLSLVLTDRAQPWAFYSLPTRAWELAGGGVLALAAPRLRRLPNPAATGLGWVGLAAVGWAAVGYSPHTQYPGTAALLPVAGAIGVIAAGCAQPRSGPHLLLSGRPMQDIGRLSYSLYLWHWPVLIIGAALVHGPLGRAGLVGLSALLAAGTVRLVEDPVRRAGGLVQVPARALALGAALTATAVLAATGAAVGAPVPMGSGPAAAVTALGAPARGAIPGAASRAVRPEPFPGLEAAQLPVLSAVAQGASVEQVPLNLTPTLTAARRDVPRPFRDGCDLRFTADVSPPCVYGDTSATTRVIAFGDSHAAQWFPALNAAAVQDHWKLENLSKATCPPLLLPLVSPQLGRTFRECESWRTSVLARIAAERPALVILDMARHYGPEYHFVVYSPAWVSALGDMVRRLRSTGARVLVVGPTPKPPGDVPDCLSQHLDDVAACTAPLVDEVSLPGSAAERAAVLRAGGAYLDVAPWVCTLGRCADIVENLLVFRDDNHFTAEYPAWLTPLVATVVSDELRAQRGSGQRKATAPTVHTASRGG